MNRPPVSSLALFGAVTAAGTSLAFWVIWGAHQAPRAHLADTGALAVAGLLVAILARSPRARRPGPEAVSPSALPMPTRVWAPWLAPALWTLCGGLLGAVAMGSLAVAPWLLVSSLCFAVAGSIASRGVRLRTTRGIAVALAAALLNAVVIWTLLFSEYAHVSPEAFRARDFYANELVADVPVHDIWIIPLTSGGEGRTVQDVQAVMAGFSPWEANSTVVVLVAIRGVLGWLFGWDEESFDEPQLSYLPRVSDEIRARSLQEPGVKGGYFRLMYSLDNETVAEILNRTVHAFFCMAIEPADDGYEMYWVIFVKEEKSLTPFYMALIDPFRRYLVHPMILRSLQQHWRHRYEAQSLPEGG
jgi:hypothetical protein